MVTPASGPGKLSSQNFDELFLSTYPRLVSLLRRMLENACAQTPRLLDREDIRRSNAAPLRGLVQL
jgi:hypothetical protein